MTGESYNVRPVGKIVVRGTPIMQAEKVLDEGAVAGMLVAVNGNDYHVKKCTAAANPCGWISFEHTDYKVRPSAYETPFLQNDTVTVVSGGSFEIYALASAGESAPLSITEGDPLVPADGGYLTACTAGSSVRPVALAAESVTVPAGAVGRIHVISTI
ncbi:MAG TPA: hypothetical protein O0X27_04130 [Methanocorpusculum sp.]|nr:hypothetical protein [Methanocorpusculum sp.]